VRNTHAPQRIDAGGNTDATTTWTWGGSAAAHNIGQLQSISNGLYGESIAFDALARPISRTIAADTTYQYQYAYNGTTGFLDTLRYPTSNGCYNLIVKYDYLNGQLRSVQDFSNNTLGTVYWQVDAAAQFGSTLDTLGNGVKVQNDFDVVTGTLSRVQAGVGGGAAIQNQSFLYDVVGNLSQRQNNNRGLTENVVNDAVDRISSATVNGTANLAMSYATSGNIQTKTGTAGTWTYSASKPHQVTQAGSNAFGYDANGNMISRNGYAIYWNSANYPTEIRGPTETFLFAYGPDRQRVRQISANAQGSETTYYVGGALEKTILVDGSTDYRHTVYAGGQAVAIVSRSSSGTNTTRYLIEDHQGSSTTITSSVGAVLVEESFDAYGVPRDPTNWSGAQSATDQALIANITRHGYTGHTMLGNSGLIHMNGRVMDASIGRFISPDPYVTEPGNTQNFNRYSYVYNNPLSFIDPTGFLTTLPPVSCPAGGCDRGIRPGIRLMPGDVRPAGGTHDSSKEVPELEEVVVVANAIKTAVKALKRAAVVVLCALPAFTLGAQAQANAGFGPMGWELQSSVTATTHGQVIFQLAGAKMWGPVFAGAAVSASAPQFGALFSDQRTGPTQGLAVDFFGVAEFESGGGSAQISGDGASGQFKPSGARTGPEAAVGSGGFVGAGWMTGHQWVFGGFCSR
jgi:RHS repeat-associated protein